MAFYFHRISNKKSEWQSHVTTLGRSSEYANEMSWTSNVVQGDKQLLMRSVVTQSSMKVENNLLWQEQMRQKINVGVKKKAILCLYK